MIFFLKYFQGRSLYAFAATVPDRVFANQAIRVDAVAMAGATLVPIVTNAHTIAAKNEANWVRDESVILKFLYDVDRTIRLQKIHCIGCASF